MKLIIGIMIILLVVLQYKLWGTTDGLSELWRLQSAVKTQEEHNQIFEKQNQQILAEVNDLKSGKDAIEAHAREDLGMIKEGEEFYQIVEKP